MGIKTSDVLVHWNYYLALEQDLGQVSRFVEFSEPNFSTYSIELAHLLLAAASEVDVVLKELCCLVAPDARRNNIDSYKEVVVEKLPELIKEECRLPRFSLTLHPWSNWEGENNPRWWRSYNKVKHQRASCYAEASLKNTLNAMAALNTAIVYFYRAKFTLEQGELKMCDVTSRLQPEPSLIRLDESYYYQGLMVLPG